MRSTVRLIAAVAIAATACTPSVENEGGRSAPAALSPEVVDVGTNPDGELLRAPDGARRASTTPASGNRLYVDGEADLAGRPLAVDVDGRPVWIVGAPTADGGGLWVVVTDGGVVVGFHAREGAVTRVDLGTDQHDPSAPPVLVVRDGHWQLLDPPADASRFSPPLVLEDGRLAYVADDGDLVIGDHREDADLLPDTRLTLSSGGEVAALFGPTDVYDHAVLGDPIEARGLRVTDTTPPFDSVTTEPQPDADAPDVPVVLEGTSVLFADIVSEWPGDEWISTRSSDAKGAGLRVDSLRDGGLSGQAVGRGGRWRHVIGAYEAEDGSARIAEVVTPHLSGTVQFLERDRGLLVPTATGDGRLGSHRIGTRNLDDAALVRLASGGSTPALVGPGLQRRSLIAVAERREQVVVLHDLDLGAGWATNLGVVQRTDGATDLAVGLDDGRVLFWTR